MGSLEYMGCGLIEIEAPLLNTVDDLPILDPFVQLKVLELLTSIALFNSLGQTLNQFQAASSDSIRADYREKAVDRLIGHAENIARTVNEVQPVLLDREVRSTAPRANNPHRRLN